MRGVQTAPFFIGGRKMKNKNFEISDENTTKVAKNILEDIRNQIRANQEEMAELYERIEVLEYMTKELQYEELALMIEFGVV